ncbi:hypothetical protein ACTFIW_012522 [Dictyostelium discoideum]
MNFLPQKTSVWQFKAYQAWVKTILITELVEENDTAAEIYSAIGLDTGKWERAKIKRYYCFESSKSNAIESKNKWLAKNEPFEADFITIDLNKDNIESFLQPIPNNNNNNNNNINNINNNNINNSSTNNSSTNNINNNNNNINIPKLPQFDVIACFDGLQNSFTDPTQAEQFIKNASSRLKVGGFFFGMMPDSSALWYKAQKETSSSGLPIIKSNLFNITFDSEIQSFFGCKYNLTIPTELNLSENLVHFPSFLNLCKKYNLTLVEATNLSEFYDENKKNYESKLKQSGVYINGIKKIEQNQLDLIGLYTTFIFVKELPQPKIIKIIN